MILLYHYRILLLPERFGNKLGDEPSRAAQESSQMKSSDEKTSIQIKRLLLEQGKKKNTPVYHIKICLLTVSYMKCQQRSRTGGTAVRKIWAWQWSSAPRFGGSKWSARQELEEEQDTWKLGEEIFQASVIKRKNKEKTTLKQLHKKSESKEHSLTSLALQTCQIKDNMQMRVPLQKILESALLCKSCRPCICLFIKGILKETSTGPLGLFLTLTIPQKAHCRMQPALFIFSLKQNSTYLQNYM